VQRSADDFCSGELADQLRRLANLKSFWISGWRAHGLKS